MSNSAGPCPGEVLAGTAQGSIAGSLGVVTPRLCTKSCYKREAREAQVISSSDSDWVQTGLFGHQFLTEFLLFMFGSAFCLTTRFSCSFIFPLLSQGKVKPENPEKAPRRIQPSMVFHFLQQTDEGSLSSLQKQHETMRSSALQGAAYDFATRQKLSAWNCLLGCASDAISHMRKVRLRN